MGEHPYNRFFSKEYFYWEVFNRENKIGGDLFKFLRQKLKKMTNLYYL